MTPAALARSRAFFHKATVFQHIQLKPHRPVDGRRDFFNRAHRHGGQGKGNALGSGGLGGLHFTTAGVHAGQADRGQGHWHAQGFIEQAGFQAQFRHVAQHALAQRNVRQVGDVALERVFGIGAAIDVVEQKRRQPALGGGAVVGGGRNDHGVTQVENEGC